MSDSQWDVPQTEEGLQELLRRLETCRAAGDDLELGRGLLALEHLVKWVRSDTDSPPFVRSHELAREALEAFRRCGNIPGQVRALVASAAMADRRTKESVLAEAEKLAASLDDEKYVAMVLSARARGLAMFDQEQASVMHVEALEIYRRIDNRPGQARTLFSLSIGSGSGEQKRDYALEAARLYRELGDRKMAARCTNLAVMNAEEIEPLVNLEALIREGLEDALSAGSRSDEAYFYRKLMLVCTAKGDLEEADKYRRWVEDLDAADGMTPLERWKNSVAMTKMVISIAKTMGNKQAVDTFRLELKRLKADKPRRES